MKPCPFCGCRALPTPIRVKAGYYFGCSGCDESGPVEKTEKKAAEEWNALHKTSGDQHKS